MKPVNSLSGEAISLILAKTERLLGTIPSIPHLQGRLNHES
jgi:hypothetical protein